MFTSASLYKKTSKRIIIEKDRLLKILNLFV